MNRLELREQLAGMDLDQRLEEQESRRRMLELLDSGLDCFSRSCFACSCHAATRASICGFAKSDHVGGRSSMGFQTYDSWLILFSLNDCISTGAVALARSFSD